MRWGVVIFALAGCTGELEQQVGLFEPIRVPAGEFIEEEIVEVGSGPAVTSIAAASGILNVGQQGRSLVGRTTADAYAVALRLEDVGRLTVSIAKIRPFLIADGWTPGALTDLEHLRASVAPKTEQLELFA